MLGSTDECADGQAGAGRVPGGCRIGSADQQLTSRSATPEVADAAAGSNTLLTDNATAVSCFHRTGNRPGFIEWALQVEAAARTFPGFVQSQLAAPEPAIFDWSMAVSFRTEAELHDWLDSDRRATLLTAGASRGFVRTSTDVVLCDGALPPTGLGAFRHTVAPGMTVDFVALQAKLVELSSHFSGFEGGTVLPPPGAVPTGAGDIESMTRASITTAADFPAPDLNNPALTAPESTEQSSTEWLSILRFRTDHQLQAWLNSAERQGALPQLRSQLTEDFSVITHSTPFGSILRIQDGTTRVTPNWKTAMLVLLVLYPTVMTLSRFLGPVLDNLGAAPWLSMWLSQIVSVGLMTWFFMPTVTGWFRRWLDPVDGAGPRISLIGAGIVVVVYLATLALFASVNWLQFWDYVD